MQAGIRVKRLRETEDLLGGVTELVLTLMGTTLQQWAGVNAVAGVWARRF